MTMTTLLSPGMHGKQETCGWLAKKFPEKFSTRVLSNTAATTRERVLVKLAQAQSVCLTIDLWSNRQMRGFIGITGHCIINWTMESVMLTRKRFTGRHIAENSMKKLLRRSTLTITHQI